MDGLNEEARKTEANLHDIKYLLKKGLRNADLDKLEPHI